MTSRTRTGASLLVVALLTALVVAGAKAQQLPESKGAPKVGEKAPDFTLPDTAGNLSKLSDLLAGPEKKGQWVLLVFYRGYW